MAAEPVPLEPGTQLADRAAIQSIERASQILELFDQDTTSLSPVLVSERLGLNRTTAHRYLTSMQAAGLLGKGLTPGPLLEQVATFISGRRRLLELAPAIMRGLSDKTGITVVLSIWGRTGAVVALVEESGRGQAIVTVRVGTVIDHHSAQARVLLAYQSDPAEIERYLSTLSAEERHRTQQNLAKVRSTQLGMSELEELGLTAIAVPVFGQRDVEAAMAFIGTTTAISLPEKGEEVQLLQRAADDLSNLLGA